MKNIFNILDGKSITRSFATLEAGEHRVKISSIIYQFVSENGEVLPFTDRVQRDSTIKEATPPWKDETPQVFVSFVKDNKFFAHRFSLLGFKSKKDADYVATKGEQILSSPNYDEQYVCLNGERIVSEEKTNTACSIFLEFLKGLNVSLETLKDAPDTIVGKETTLVLKDANAKIVYKYCTSKMPKEVAVVNANSEEM